MRIQYTIYTWEYSTQTVPNLHMRIQYTIYTWEYSTQSTHENIVHKLYTIYTWEYSTQTVHNLHMRIQYTNCTQSTHENIVQNLQVFSTNRNRMLWLWIPDTPCIILLDYLNHQQELQHEVIVIKYMYLWNTLDILTRFFEPSTWTSTWCIYYEVCIHETPWMFYFDHLNTHFNMV